MEAQTPNGTLGFDVSAPTTLKTNTIAKSHLNQKQSLSSMSRHKSKKAAEKLIGKVAKEENVIKCQRERLEISHKVGLPFVTGKSRANELKVGK